MRVWILAVAAALTALVAPGRATVFVPLPLSQLARSSTAVVIASVAGVAGERDSSGRIVTAVAITVESVLRGNVGGGTIVLHEDGGSLDTTVDVVSGSPQFVVGEHVLLFLTTRPDGSWRTNHLTLGKWPIHARGGQLWVGRDYGAGAAVILLPGDSAEQLPLDVAIEEIEAATGARVRPRAAASEVATPAPWMPAAFRLRGPARFFELDEGMPLTFLIDARGDAALGLDSARSAVQQAFAQWSSVAGATIAIADEGLAADLSGNCPDRPNLVVFDDPRGFIPDPVDCHGVLAVSGTCDSTFEKKVFHDTEFARARRGLLTFANGWGGCEIWTPCNLAEIATHEVGHILGLDHSSDSDDEPDFDRRDATMYFRAHFDGRCAELRSDDLAGAQFIYPAALPPTITTTTPLPDAVVGVPFAVQLEASGGKAPYTWSLAPRSGGIAGLELEATGLLAGLPIAIDSSFFLVQATDASGDSHTKVLNIRARNPLTPASTATATATPTKTLTTSPTPSPTRTLTRTTTATRTSTPSRTPTASRTSSQAPSPEPSPTFSPPETHTAPPNSPTPSPTATAPSTETPTTAPRATDTPTVSPTETPTASETPTATAKIVPTATSTGEPTETPPPTPTVSASRTATIPSTATATRTASVPLSPSPSPTPTLPTATCGGDCDGDLRVTVNELLLLVTVALGAGDVGDCPAGDADGNGQVTVDEIVLALDRALGGCPAL